MYLSCNNSLFILAALSYSWFGVAYIFLFYEAYSDYHNSVKKQKKAFQFSDDLTIALVFS